MGMGSPTLLDSSTVGVEIEGFLDVFPAALSEYGFSFNILEGDMFQ